MYIPASFREDRLDVQHELIRTNPLGLLVTAGPGGLMANLIPFLIDSNASEFGTLRAHLARANPQLKELERVDECLIVFQGPQSYISPSWYEETKGQSGSVVPTWNYVTVHAWCCPRVIEDDDWLRGQLTDLTDSQEHARDQPWSVADAPSEFIENLMKSIIGFECPIHRIEGKWKVSQNQPEANRLGVIAGLQAQGTVSEAMANLMAERLERPDS